MLRIKKPLVAIIAALLITASAFAGNIPGPGAEDPPPCPEGETCATGNIPGPGYTFDPLLELGLNVVISILK